jgi:aspartyl-tRNA(Asn)/glutamyl-tRNA(Gln) amidotransferase subunit C
MDKKIDQDQVKNVAKLARLELTQEQTDEFSKQLSEILEYVEKMNELDTSDIEPLAHCLAVNNCLRPDVAKPSLGTDTVLKNAPQTDEDFFKVPKILDESAAS